MLRETLIRTVADGLSMLVTRLQGRSAARLFDLNIVSEDFFKDFLNSLSDLALENLNRGGQNHPAIDLGDKARRVSYQITTEHTSRKIQGSLDKFLAHKLDQDYSELSFVIVGKKQTKYTSIKSGTLQFNPTQHILDIGDLTKQATSAGIDRLQKLAALIEKEGLVIGLPKDTLILRELLRCLPPNGSVRRVREQDFAGLFLRTDLKDFVAFAESCFNPAFRFQEGNLEQLRKALLSAINRFMSEVGVCTVMTVPNGLRVPPELEYRNPSMFQDRVTRITSAARSLCAAYDALVSNASDRLGFQGTA